MWRQKCDAHDMNYPFPETGTREISWTREGPTHRRGTLWTTECQFTIGSVRRLSTVVLLFDSGSKRLYKHTKRSHICHFVSVFVFSSCPLYRFVVRLGLVRTWLGLDKQCRIGICSKKVVIRSEKVIIIRLYIFRTYFYPVSAINTHISSCLVLSCLVLSCLVLSCIALSSLV